MAFWDTLLDIGAYKLQAINKSDKWSYYVLAVEKDYFKNVGILNKLLFKVTSGFFNQKAGEFEYINTGKLIYEYLLRKNLQQVAEEFRSKGISLYQFTEHMDEYHLNEFLKYLTPLLIENINAFSIEDLMAVYKKAGLFLASGESRVLIKQRLIRYVTNTFDAFTTQNGKFPTFSIYVLDEDFKRVFTQSTHPSDAWLIYDSAVHVADRDDIEKDDIKRIAMGGNFTHLY